MNRAGRLQAAHGWLERYRGKHLVRSYARWFGVDLGCALRELEMLGVALDPDYVERLRTTLRNRPPRRRPTVDRADAVPKWLEEYIYPYDGWHDEWPSFDEGFDQPGDVDRAIETEHPEPPF